MSLLKDILREDNYETKDGIELNFEYEKNVAERTNKGFIVNKLKTFIHSRQVGYLKIAYVPSEDVDYYFPTIFHFMDQVKGWHLLEHEDDFNSPKVYPGDEEFAKEAHNRRGIQKVDDFPDWREYDEVSDERWEELADYYKKEIRETFNDQFQKYLDYYVDKPYVDYSSVDEDYRRRRIGFNMYKKMAKMLGEKGMVLYSSTIQTDEAQAVWEKLKEVLPVKKTVDESFVGEEVVRYYIDYR